MGAASSPRALPSVNRIGAVVSTDSIACAKKKNAAIWRDNRIPSSSTFRDKVPGQNEPPAPPISVLHRLSVPQKTATAQNTLLPHDRCYEARLQKKFAAEEIGSSEYKNMRHLLKSMHLPSGKFCLRRFLANRGQCLHKARCCTATTTNSLDQQWLGPEKHRQCRRQCRQRRWTRSR